MVNTQNPQVRQLAVRQGDYGVDAPYVPVILGVLGLVFLAAGLADLFSDGFSFLTVILLAYAALMLTSTFSYLYATRRGKFQVWAEILARLNLTGNERVLDMGCGRGAVLLMAAQLLPGGKAVGADLWRSVDQSGNAQEVTGRNAELEGVARRVELHTADMTQLPFPNNSFDLVVSSLAIHNIKSAAGRAQAVDEAVRVLKPGGRIILADFQKTAEYEACLRERGLQGISHQNLGWRFWFGGPWTATRLVAATKPASSAGPGR